MELAGKLLVLGSEKARKRTQEKRDAWRDYDQF